MTLQQLRYLVMVAECGGTAVYCTAEPYRGDPFHRRRDERDRFYTIQ